MTLNYCCPVSHSNPSHSSIKGPESHFPNQGSSDVWLLVGLFYVRVEEDSVTLMSASKLQYLINSGQVASLSFFLILKRVNLCSWWRLTFFWPVLFTSLFSQRGTEGFWKSVAHYVPREPSEIRILNPYFIQEAAFHFIGLPFNNGLMGKGVRHMQGALTHIMDGASSEVGGLGMWNIWLAYKYAVCYYMLGRFERWLSPCVTLLAQPNCREKSKVEKLQMIL